MAMRLHFGGRTGPDLRPHDTQQRFIVGVDGDKQMNKEAETCAIAAQPQLPPPVAPGKIDLVVSCATTTRRPRQACAVRWAASSVIARGVACSDPRKRWAAISPARSPPKLANHQRARTGDVLEDPLKSTRNSNIATETSAHQRPPKTEQPLN